MKKIINNWIYNSIKNHYAIYRLEKDIFRLNEASNRFYSKQKELEYQIEILKFEMQFNKPIVGSEVQGWTIVDVKFIHGDFMKWKVIAINKNRNEFKTYNIPEKPWNQQIN